MVQKRGQPSWAALVGAAVLAGGMLALLSCGGGIAGIDSALKVEDGSVRVTGAERAAVISQYGQTANPQPGNEFVFVSVEVKGTAPLAGVTEGVHNLLEGRWALTDGGGRRYGAGGVVDGKLVFEVKKPATGLVLWLGDQIQVPLGGFFGEEVVQVTAAPSASATSAPPVASPTPVPTDTPPPPTEPPLPSGPPGGATFQGQFEGGTVEFTIGANGDSVLGCRVNIEGPVPCSDGGTISGVQGQYDFSTPIEDLAFEYVSSGAGGITFRGAFENETAAKGTLEMTMVIQGATCAVGPVDWTATSSPPVVVITSTPGPVETPAPAGPVMPRAGLPEPPATFACPSPRVNDFTSLGGFRTGDVSWGSWGVIAGEYYFALKQPDSWGWVSDGVKTADAIFEVDARQAAEGPGVYGLAFGGNNLTDGQQVHAFVIDKYGQYGLFRHTQAGDWVQVQPFTYSFLLYQEGETNRLKVVRSGPLIALYANGFPLALTAFYDENYTGARYAGFLAWSNEAGGLEARFDNYTVCPLTEPYPMPVNPFAEKTVRWPAGQPAVLNWVWFATTGELASAFADLSDISLIVDGQPYSGLDEYWSAPSPYAGGYGVQWNLPLPPLEAGTHRIEANLSLAEQISDGFDENQDGAQDLYGPGPVVTGWVELNVEP